MKAMILTALFILSIPCSAAERPSPSDWLIPHNQARAKKGVPPLAWSKKLKVYTKKWLKELRDNHECGLVHSKGPYGENLGKRWGKPYFESGRVVQAWLYEETTDYDYETNTCRGVCGHYTQVVWAKSKLLGCAAISCSKTVKIYGCSYDPPGNYKGEKPY